MTQAFSIYSLATGKVLRNGYVSSGTPEDQVREGEGVLHSLVDWETHYVADGEPVPMGARPSPHHTFNWATKEWHDPRSLQDFKVLKNAYVNAARLEANNTTFSFSGKLIAVDALSRGDIDAVHGIVVLTNEMPNGWVGGWKTVDNSYVSIPDVAAWTLFYKAMVGQGSINFAHSQALKAQLAAATTIKEVEAIVW